MTAARRILLVDDEIDIRESLKEIIEMQVPGAQVTMAGSGAEALRLLGETRPQLIVTDFKMPGMTGLDFLAAARSVLPHTPRILITAYADLDVATKSINDAHVQSFLSKPVDPEDIVARVVRIFQAAEAKDEKERALAQTVRDLDDALKTVKE